MDEDQEAQSDEIMVLESILDPHAFHVIQTRTVDKPTSGALKIDFHFPASSSSAGGFTAKAVTRKEDKSFQKLSQSVAHLPPLSLHFILPTDYPSQSKPVFTLSSTWLDRLSVSKMPTMFG